MAFCLRDYQDDAHDAFVKAYTAGEKAGLLKMAPGLGKTFSYIAFVHWYLTQNPGKKVVFLVKQRSLLRQAKREFERIFYRELFRNEITFGIHTSSDKKNLDAQVMFYSTQLFASHIKKKKISVDEFDLLIFDEAHNEGAPLTRRALKKLKLDFAMGGTATDIRKDGKNILDFFGRIVYEFSFAKALAQNKWLARLHYMLFLDDINMEEFDEIFEDLDQRPKHRKFTREDIDRRIFIEERLDKISQIIKMKRGYNKKTLIFCRSKTHARKVQKHFDNARIIDSNFNEVQNEKTLKDFKEGKFLDLLVVDKLNEGIDVPAIEIIVFLRVTFSTRIFIQQLGRGTRKTWYDSVTLVMDFVGNCERILQIREFKRAVQEEIDRINKKRIKTGEALDISLGFELMYTSKHIGKVELLLEKLTKNFDFYPTLEEASQAAINLSIKTQKEYHKRYTEDPKLPCHPPKYYLSDWKNWKYFLKTNLYTTLEEASKAAIDLKITSISEYTKRYTEDPKLPYNPHLYYSDEWVNWYHFLGKEKKQYYKTLREASKASITLGIKTQKEYKKKYKEDPKLHSNPNEYYSDEWTNWPNYLGRNQKSTSTEELTTSNDDEYIPIYETWEEASQAAQALGITTSTQYKENYSLDPHLPSNPHQYYKKVWKQNGAWYGFLGKEIPAKYQQLKEAA